MGCMLKFLKSWSVDTPGSENLFINYGSVFIGDVRKILGVPELGLGREFLILGSWHARTCEYCVWSPLFVFCWFFGVFICGAWVERT